MNKSLLLPLLVLCMLKSAPSFSQTRVDIDKFTGTANVMIPLYNIKSGAVNVPIMLTYTGAGIKVKDIEGSAGMGWNLIAGGEIVRELRDLPDDGRTNGYYLGQSRLGWLYNTNGYKIQGLSFANDNNDGTCTDEQTDIDSLNAKFGDLSDTEPDVFHVNAPGLSCRLVFDKDHVLRTIPYQDLKISYTTDLTTYTTDYAPYGRITSFTITNDQGIKYVFSDIETTTRTAESSNPSSILYFKNQYDKYSTYITYASAWKLTLIEDMNNNGASFSYNPASTLNGDTRIAMAIGTSSTVTYPFTIKEQATQRSLSKITYNNSPDGLYPLKRSFTFTYRNASASGKAIIDSLEGPGKKVKFYYPTTSHAFLGTIILPEGNITFDYYKQAGGGLHLPDSTSKAIDAWGYYNGASNTHLLPETYINPSNSSLERYRYHAPGSSSGSYPYTLTGANRTVNADSLLLGSLKTISNEHGGVTTLVYEPNEFYDPTAATVVKGGGLRLKKIIEYDGIDTAHNLVRNFSFINPATGTSSGKAISIPSLAFTIPYTGSGTTEAKWQSATVRLEENLSPEPAYVGYTHVRETFTGIGNTLYEFLTPATNWDSSAGSDWLPTLVLSGKPGCAAAGYVNNQIGAYPYIPNPNYDFERGLLKKVSVYDQSGNLVNESNYTYARTGSTTVIQALKFELNNYLYAYAKYPLFVGVDNLMTQISRKDYDAPSTSQYKQTVVNNTYGSSYHKLLTSRETVNSDGNIVRTYTKYVKDYSATSSGDAATMAMYNLQQLNANIPIETYTQVERSSVNKTISASLLKFKPFSTAYKNMYVADKTLAFSDPVGVTDFSVSTVSSGNFVNDPRYYVTQNFLVHDHKGMAISTDNAHKLVQTLLSDYTLNQPVAQFSQARADEIGFNDFDTEDLNTGFINSATDSLELGSRTGLKAAYITSSNYFTRSIVKNPEVDNYIFSVWVKSTSTGNITVSLTNASSATYNYTVAFANTGGDWKYIELKVPLSNMSSTFSAKFQSDATIRIDDVLFYPEHVTVNTFAYNRTFNAKQAETNTNGNAVYFTLDGKGRLKHTLDQDKNIVSKRSYAAAKEQDDFTVSINNELTGSVTYNTPITFRDYGGSALDNEGTAYTWDFGDGTPTITTYKRYGEIVHQYTTANTFTATLSKTSNKYGTATGTLGTTTTNGSTVGVLLTNSVVGDPYGKISEIRFYQGTTLIATYSESDLNAGTYGIAQGVYKMVVDVTGNAYDTGNPSGYQRIRATATWGGTTYPLSQCKNATVGATGTVSYTFNSIDLNGKTKMNIFVDSDPCLILIP